MIIDIRAILDIDEPPPDVFGRQVLRFEILNCPFRRIPLRDLAACITTMIIPVC